MWKLTLLILLRGYCAESRLCYYDIQLANSTVNQSHIECANGMGCCGDITAVYCCENYDVQQVSTPVIITIVVVVGGAVLLALIIGVAVYCVHSMTSTYRVVGQYGGSAGIVIAQRSHEGTHRQQFTTQARHPQGYVPTGLSQPESMRTVPMVRTSSNRPAEDRFIHTSRI